MSPSSPASPAAHPADYRYDGTLPPASAMLEELLRATEIQQLFESYYNLLNIPVAIIDLNANVLLSSPWRRLCVEFHRVNPATCARCIKSDTILARKAQEGQPYAIYNCENGLTDSCSPIVVDGSHVANLFIGQFLTAAPDVARFRAQAKEFGFEEDTYLAALHEVPIVNEERVPAILDLLTKITRVITTLSVDRKHALEDRERHEVILDAIPQAVFWKDRQGRYVGCNAAFARATGLPSASEIVGKTDYDMPWPKAEADAYRAADAAVLASNAPRWHIIEPLQTANGSRLIIDTSKIPLLGADRVPYGVLGVYEDITERSEAEARLKASEEQFRKAFMASADAFYLATLNEGRILAVNDRFVDVFGFAPDETIGRTSLELNLYQNAEDRSRVVAELRARGSVRELELGGRRKDGTLMTVLLSIQVVDSDPEPLIIGVVRDITEQKRAREEHAKLEEQFRQAQKMEAVGRLAGGVAHDFNNLLTVINGYAALLRDSADMPAEFQADLSQIKRAGDRAAGLTRQLLAFSRRQVLQPRVLDLGALVRDTEPMLQRLLGEDIVLSVLAQPAAGSVRADAGQVEQVLLNLAVNSRDAMPRGGTLTIETMGTEADADFARSSGMAAGSYVVLSVRDTGCGIPEEVRAHMFEPFFTTKAAGKGTGLGLSTVYGIVTQAGGHIDVQSEVGHGTTIRIYFPRCDAREEQEVIRQEGAPALSGSETILVVEDEPALAALTRRMLEQGGYTVLLAGNAKEAIALANAPSAHVDLLMTDIVMPGLSGVQLTEELVRTHPGLRVLLVSGYVGDALVEHGLPDTRHFLPKPFSDRQLLEKVRAVLSEGPAFAGAAAAPAQFVV